jgi:hypothetical protein
MRASNSIASTTRQNGLSPSSLRCDNCRGEFNGSIDRYWHMQFCSSTCMTAYQQRLAPETKLKINRIDVLRSAV